MDLDRFSALVARGDCHPITAAATRLHRSQSAISRRLSLLESALGAPLFDRLGTSLALTEVGQDFLPFAEQALGAVSAGKEAALARLGSQQGPVTMAIVGTLVEAAVAKALGRLARKTSRLRVLTVASHEISRLVLRGEAHFGIRYFDEPSSELTCEQVAVERMCVVQAARGDVAQRWIGFPPSRTIKEDFGRLLERQLRAAGMAETEVMQVDSLSAQKRLVEQGFGLALLPRSSVRDELKRGTLRLANLPRMEIDIPVVLVVRKSVYLNLAARHAMQALCVALR